MPGPQPSRKSAINRYAAAPDISARSVALQNRPLVNSSRFCCIARQHVLDEILGLGAVHGVQGRPSAGRRRLSNSRLPLAVLLHALDRRPKAGPRPLKSCARRRSARCRSARPGSRSCNASGCRLAITRALSCSTALYAVRRASFLYLTGRRHVAGQNLRRIVVHAPLWLRPRAAGPRRCPCSACAIRQSVCASMAVSAVCSLRLSGRVLRIRHQRVIYFMRLNSALNG